MATNERKTRIVIVDDEPIAREGIRTQLLREPSVEIVAESVQFLGSRGDGDSSGGGNQFVPAGAGSESGADFPAAADDDIPF